MKTTAKGNGWGMSNNKTGRVQSAGQVCERFGMKMPSNTAGKSISHAYCQRPGTRANKANRNDMADRHRYMGRSQEHKNAIDCGPSSVIVIGI